MRKLLLLLLFALPTWAQQSSPPALPTNLYTTPSYIGSTASGITSYNAIDLSQPPYSLKTALFVPDASSVNTSKTITCPNSDCNFTTSMTGFKVYGICNNGAAQCPPVGTITTVNSASSITVSNAATFTATGSVTLVYGPDSTSALTAATAAAWLLCPNTSSVKINFPVGYFLTSSPQFNNPPASCAHAPVVGIGEGGGITFEGQGKFTSALVPTPDFAFIANGQFFSGFGTNATANILNMGINGMGWTCPNVTTGNAVAMSPGGTNAFLNHVGLLNWCTNPTDSFTGITTPSAGYLQNDTIVDGFGTIGESVGGACCNQIYGGWIDNIGTGNPGTGNSLVVVGGGSVYTHNMQIGQGSHVNEVQVGSGATWVSDGDQITNFQGSICIDARNNNATVTLKNSTVSCTFATFEGIATSTNTGVTIIAENSTITGGATNGWLNGGAGTTFIDKGGNTYSGAIVFTGRYVGPTNSARNTACATGNFALTSGWGTSSVTSVAANGDIQGCHVTITGAAGSAGPVLTWTYPQAPQVAPGSCHLSGVSGTLTGVSTGTPGATTVAYTFTGTPSAQTYNFDAGCP